MHDLLGSNKVLKSNRYTIALFEISESSLWTANNALL